MFTSVTNVPAILDRKPSNSLESLKTYTKPKLFFYALQDTINNPEETKKAFAESAEPKQLIAVDTEHDYRLHEDKLREVNQAVKNFLRSNP